MRYFPLFLDLAGQTVLVIGSGETAERRAGSVAQGGAIVRRASRFAPSLLDGCGLAIGAGAPEEDLRALSLEARRRGIPVNVVDCPELCSFITPAVIERDPITIAISTGGAAPVLARLLRGKIEAIVPPAYGALAALAGRFQAEIRRLLPELPSRRRVLERALTGPAAELVFAGRIPEAEAAFTAAIQGPNETESSGIVFLVGAGPGAADLLTLRAQRLLGEADVIVHDRLVSDEVLAMARRDAERIYVGKARGDHCLPQDQINALLVRLASEGRKVVRLKGGDPFIFGRGGEEMEALAAAGLRWEVVPGITAALGCAAQAGIPLTHRDGARSLTFVTGHNKNGQLDIDFAELARSKGTLAIYMGLHGLAALHDGLIAAGMDPGIPAALIERGGSARQRVLQGSLASIAATGADWAIEGPTLIMIGAVVARTHRP